VLSAWRKAGLLGAETVKGELLLYSNTKLITLDTVMKRLPEFKGAGNDGVVRKTPEPQRPRIPITPKPF
jgi:hypothetical protein